MNRYATEREAFGKPLNFFGQMQRYIADSYAEYKSAKAYVYETARRMNLCYCKMPKSTAWNCLASRTTMNWKL